MTSRQLAIRLIVLATAILGLNYIIWRWMVSILSGAELPDDLSASGRGLALAKVALDQFSYAKEDDGNRWTLLCRRKSEATAPQ
jgi:hypothetical protein